MRFGTKSSGLLIKGGLKIEGCKIKVLLYILEKELILTADWLSWLVSNASTTAGCKARPPSSSSLASVTFPTRSPILSRPSARRVSPKASIICVELLCYFQQVSKTRDVKSFTFCQSNTSTDLAGVCIQRSMQSCT